MAWVTGNTLNSAQAGAPCAGSETAAVIMSGWGGSYIKVSEKWDGTSWTTGNSSTYDHYLGSSAGTQTAALAAGGYNGSASIVECEKFDGTSFSSTGSLSTARREAAGFGSQSDAIATCGNSGTTIQSTEHFNGTSWSAGADTGVNKYRVGGCGERTAGLIFGGNTSPSRVDTSQEYDGTTWTSGGTLTTATDFAAGAGTQTEAKCIGGATGAANAVTTMLTYNGTSWSSSDAMNTARNRLSSAPSPSTSNYALAAGGFDASTVHLNVTESYSAFNIYSYTGTGGGISGGAASITSSVTHVSSGGGIGGGSATQLQTSYFEASGGGVAGGNADYLFDGGGYYTMSGGAIAGGSADITTSFSHVATGGGIVGGTAPYSFTITAVTMEILWRIVNPSTDALLTGESANTKVKIRRTPDGYVYDWNDATFKASGWTTIAPTMSEVDATNLPGLYKKEVNIAAFVDGWYQVYADYTGTFNDYSDAEFLISSGNLVDIKTSTNLDAQVSTVNTNVLSRLADADYTAPDNAGIADLPTLAEMLAGGVAKESTLATINTIVTLLRKHDTNKMVEVDNGNRTKTFTVYDNDNTTAILTYTYNVDTLTRAKATE